MRLKHPAASSRLSLCLLLLMMMAGGTATTARASEIDVPIARDLHADAALMRTARVPLLLIVSQSYCNYCQLLKKEIIKPMLVSGRYTDKVIIRELLIDSDESIRDFTGATVIAHDLAQRYREWLTPTVLLLDTKGNELVTRIRGINNVDYYGYYLDKAIDQARSVLSTDRAVTHISP
jgi:thioredoxin-related protein